MATTEITTKTMKLTSAKQQFNKIVNDVFRTHQRVLVESDGVRLAAIVSAEDLDRLSQLDAQRAADFEVLFELGRPFTETDPAEIELETRAALAEVRQDRKARAQ